MNDLRKAAEMALGALDSDNPDIQLRAAIALRQALEDRPLVKTYCGGKPNYCTPEETPEVTPEVTGEVTGEVQCKTHPDAPHGFDRNASHAADRYVCECESWEPVDAVNMSQERVDETAKSEHEPVAWADKVGAVIPHSHKLFQPDLLKDYTRPLYTAPPKREWVGLDGEIPGLGLVTEEFYNGMLFAEDILREKNGG